MKKEPFPMLTFEEQLACQLALEEYLHMKKPFQEVCAKYQLNPKILKRLVEGINKRLTLTDTPNKDIIV